MLTDKQIDRMYSKLNRFEDTLEPMIFKKESFIGDIVKYETTDRLYEIPDDSLFIPAPVNSPWGGEESLGERRAVRHICHQNCIYGSRQPLL